MTDDSEETRELGVEFGTLSEALEVESYPITDAEFLGDVLPRLKSWASHPVLAGQVNPEGWES